MFKSKKTFVLLIFVVFLVFTSLNFSLGAHYIAGVVNDAFDGTNVNNYTIYLWNALNGMDDNLTDIVGPLGNSGADNVYFIDCESLSSSCKLGDNMTLRIFNSGNDYLTEETIINVSGAGFDLPPNLTLNSPPNATPEFPLDFGNVSYDSLFNCSGFDLDYNLDNITLFGDWNGGWHANETKSLVSGYEEANFTLNISEGTYNWSCLATDNLSISRISHKNHTVNVDLTDPIINSIIANESSICLSGSPQLRISCNTSDSFTGVNNVVVEVVRGLFTQNFSTTKLFDDLFYSDIDINDTGSWNFNCISEDYSSNFNNLSLNDFMVFSGSPNLNITSSLMDFFPSNPMEGVEVNINLTIKNEGCGDSGSFLVGAYEKDPEFDPSSKQVNGNISTSVNGLSNVTINISWISKIGYTNIFSLLDVDDSISESIESDNKANKSITVFSWQDFYGNVSVDKLLSKSQLENISLWFNESSLSGNIFVSDKEANIDWTSLQAIGRNISNFSISNDFSDIDTLLNTSIFVDSVSNVFTSDGSTPHDTDNFFVHQITIADVPIINSTDNTNFVTGILWDYSDDLSGSGNGEFDQTDTEDLVFVAKVNKQKVGFYGVYDYEIKIPVRLREYDDTDNSEVYLYFDLN